MRALRLAAPGLLGLSVIVACGSDDDGADSSVVASSVSETIATPETTNVPKTTEAPDTTPAPETTSAPETETTESREEPRLLSNGVLQPGTYVGNQFEHPITLTVDEGWEAYEAFRNVDLYEVVPDGADPESGGAFAILDHAANLTIEEVITEFQSVEAVSFSEPEPTTIAGLDGMKLTAEPPSEIASFYFLGNDREWWGTPAGFRSEFHIVEAPTGTRVIAIEALPEQWESFRASAQSVIDTIVWAE